MDKDRVMGAAIDHNLLLFVLQGRARIDFDLPDDAQIVAVEHSIVRRGFVLLIQSASFDPVPVGSLVPMLPPLVVQLL